MPQIIGEISHTSCATIIIQAVETAETGEGKEEEHWLL
jgi:hypothetical protein